MNYSPTLYSIEIDAPIPNCTTSSFISTRRQKFSLQLQKLWASLRYICLVVKTLVLRARRQQEIEDILWMLHLLDNSNVLSAIQFVAVSIDRLPKYGPNELNVCAVVDRYIENVQCLMSWIFVYEFLFAPYYMSPKDECNTARIETSAPIHQQYINHPLR